MESSVRVTDSAGGELFGGLGRAVTKTEKLKKNDSGVTDNVVCVYFVYGLQLWSGCR